MYNRESLALLAGSGRKPRGSGGLREPIFQSLLYNNANRCQACHGWLSSIAIPTHAVSNPETRLTCALVSLKRLSFSAENVLTAKSGAMPGESTQRLPQDLSRAPHAQSKRKCNQLLQALCNALGDSSRAQEMTHQSVNIRELHRFRLAQHSLQRFLAPRIAMLTHDVDDALGPWAPGTTKSFKLTHVFRQPSRRLFFKVCSICWSLSMRSICG